MTNKQKIIIILMSLIISIMLFCLNKFKAIILEATFKCRHNFIFNYLNYTVKTFKMLQNIYILSKCSLNV